MLLHTLVEAETGHDDCETRRGDCIVEPCLNDAIEITIDGEIPIGNVAVVLAGEQQVMVRIEDRKDDTIFLCIAHGYTIGGAGEECRMELSNLIAREDGAERTT